MESENNEIIICVICGFGSPRFTCELHYIGPIGRKPLFANDNQMIDMEHEFRTMKNMNKILSLTLLTQAAVNDIMSTMEKLNE